MALLIILSLRNRHWIKDEGDDPEDQCAHGLVNLSVDNVHFVTDADGDWTVSAAALYLLRTVTSNHSPNDSVAEGNFLIPHCGHTIWSVDCDKYPYRIFGCDSGIDPNITHDGESVHISLGGKAATVTLVEWAKATLRFSDEVAEFYAASADKVDISDPLDKEGWEYFWSQWHAERKKVQDMLNVT